MGSPLSPVLADLFMEAFELDTIENGDLHPNLWLHYIDDTLWLGPTARQHPKSSSITWTVNIHASTSPWNKNKTTLSPSSQTSNKTIIWDFEAFNSTRWWHSSSHGTLQANTHRQIPSQLFIPSSSLQVRCLQHLGLPGLQHLWEGQLEAGTTPHQDITSTRRIQDIQPQQTQDKPQPRWTTRVQRLQSPSHRPHFSQSSTYL